MTEHTSMILLAFSERIKSAKEVLRKTNQIATVPIEKLLDDLISYIDRKESEIEWIKNKLRELEG